MTTAAPIRPDTDVDSDFESLISQEFNRSLDDSNDPERFSHYVKKEDIVRSAMTGAAIRALCGKVWTPKKSPEKFPVCPDCKEAYDQISPGDQ